jgi:sugar phosphate isomerase/epimerase
MHPAISINTLCLGEGSLAQHIAQVRALGAGALSPTLEQVAACGTTTARRLLTDAGLRVATLTHRAFGFATPAETESAQARLNETIDVAAAIEAQSITFTSGGRSALTWAQAEQRFVEAVAPCAARARAAGVALALEPTSHLYADVSIAHRLSDTVRSSRAAGVSVGIDLFACWFDSDIEDAIAAAAPLCALVQVSDYVLGDRGLPCRAVPGDGAIPLSRLIPLIAKSGYRGFFDLEIIGPRLSAEGLTAGLSRAAGAITALL